MSDSLATAEIISPEEVIENEKTAMRDYASFDPDPKRYPNLTAQEKLRFSRGTYAQQEIVDQFENRNPYNPKRFTELITTAKLMLGKQGGQQGLVGAFDYLLENFQRSKPDITGRRVSQQQVEALQDLLRQTLEAIG